MPEMSVLGTLVWRYLHANTSECTSLEIMNGLRQSGISVKQREVEVVLREELSDKVETISPNRWKVSSQTSRIGSSRQPAEERAEMSEIRGAHGSEASSDRHAAQPCASVGGAVVDELVAPVVRVVQSRTGSDLAWRFSPQSSSGARNMGNANVWTVASSVAAFVKESIQNVLDVKRDDVDSVRVNYRLIKLAGHDLERFLKVLAWDELKSHLDAASRGEAGKQKAGKILAARMESLRNGVTELFVLRVDDFGTSGLTGEDDTQWDEQRGNFAALARDNLNSQKGSSTAAGAFGLGKAVFWTTSELKTVLFCSNLSVPVKSGDFNLRILGRTELAWHAVAGGSAFEGPGWFGKRAEWSSGASNSVWNDRALVRDLHLDRPDEPGTSIMVVGFHDPEEEGELNPLALMEKLATSTAESFWPVIATGGLAVSVEYFEGREKVHASQVDPRDYVPEYFDAYEKLLNKNLSQELRYEGDVISFQVEHVFPMKKAEGAGNRTHQATLLVRLGSEQGAEGGGDVAQFRGNGMVIKYKKYRKLGPATRPFHAVLLAGMASGGENAEHADEFLRTSEPPQHDRWEANESLNSEYQRGSKKSIDDFDDLIKRALVEALTVARQDLSDGPAELKKMFMVNTPTGERREQPKIMSLNGSVHGDEWVFSEIRVSKGGAAWSFEPVPMFVSDSGSNKKVSWARLEAVTGCSLSDGGRITIHENARKVVFCGATDPDSHPLPASDCAITVELKKIRLSGGGLDA